jgi:hypothetical protein
MGPVFVFGSGRCGTTHLQRLISLNSEVWVWGEHDGFLEPLLSGLLAYEDSANLKRVFDRELPQDAQLVELVRRQGRAWLNRLHRGDLRSELRELMHRMFSRGVPQGWTGWGFKEPRYRGPNNMPAQLLDLFPECSAAVTFREPAATLASMVRSWHADHLEPRRLNDLPGLYKDLAEWWIEDIEYFIALKKSRPDSIVMLEVQQLNYPVEALLELLRLSPRADGQLVVPDITNRGPPATREAERAMAVCFEPWSDRTRTLYDAAMEMRDRVSVNNRHPPLSAHIVNSNTGVSGSGLTTFGSEKAEANHREPAIL